MMNSKGFVAPPFLIWVVVGLIALTLANKNDLIQFDLSGNKQLSTQETGIPDIEVPTANPNPVSEADLINPVKQFYSNISSKQYDVAWSLLSKNFQDYAQGYDNFVKGYKSTLSTLVKDISVQDLSDNKVYVQLESSDNVNGQIQTKTFEGTWKLALENGQWKLDSADITLESVYPTPEPATIPIPIISSTPANTPITHDGSRTGAFVQYDEWATGQKIQIYENELLSYTFPNGNQTYMTKGDIAWFEKNAKPNLVNSNNNTPSSGGYYPTYTPPSNISNSSDNDYANYGNYYPTYSSPPVVSPKEDSQINIYGGASSYTQYGNTLYGSDGSSFTRYGNTIYGSDGSSYTQYGNTVYGNEGSTYSQYGNTIYGNNGTSYTQYGNTVYGSDGSSATKYGNTIYTQPGY